MKRFSFYVLVFFAVAAIALEIDFSRRRQLIREPASKGEAAQKQQLLFLDLFSSSEPVQELVILNTSSGFVPSTVQLRKGGKYVVHVVNVNEKSKNISFILDSFSEHHATYYGKIKTFNI